MRSVAAWDGFRALHGVPLIELQDSNMPKMKTHKATKKRFRLTATGKAKHRGAGTSHLAVRISSKRRRNLRGTRVLASPMTRAVQDALRGNSY